MNHAGKLARLSELRASLHRIGLRLTPQREAVWRLFAATDRGYSLPEACAALKDQRIGQATIYRVVNTLHALWTAAKYSIPSIFVCFVNHEYRLLKELWCDTMGTAIESTHFVGMDFDDPSVDLRRIAEGFGARTEKIETLETVGEVLARAVAHPGPSFLIIDREP